MATMREAPDLGIPETKPAIESIRGVWEQKLSPRRRHALLQGRMCGLLTAIFQDDGEVGTEWRFYFLTPDEPPSSLVPDVAYVSYDRMPPSLGELREKPTISPDIAVEILSPGDKRPLLEAKADIYFAHGALLLIIVDPATRTVEMRDVHSRRIFAGNDVATSTSYPHLRIDLAALFARI